jgi:hypothetical protein
MPCIATRAESLRNALTEPVDRQLPAYRAQTNQAAGGLDRVATCREEAGYRDQSERLPLLL